MKTLAERRAEREILRKTPLAERLGVIRPAAPEPLPPQQVEVSLPPQQVEVSLPDRPGTHMAQAMAARRHVIELGDGSTVTVDVTDARHVMGASGAMGMTLY